MTYAWLSILNYAVLYIQKNGIQKKKHSDFYVLVVILGYMEFI